MSLTIGSIIKKLRKERNLTQEELAEQLNITYQAVSKWENETGMPDISQIIPLANVFGVSTDILFGTSSQNDNDEIVKIIEEIHAGSQDDPSTMPCKGWSVNLNGWHKFQNALRKYPNNHILLYNALEYGSDLALANLAGEINEAVGKTIYAECERIANLTISYNTNISDVFRAHQIMVRLHAEHGNLVKAQEHADKFPWRTDFSYFTESAFVSHFQKDYVKAADYCREAVRFHLEAIASSMMHLAWEYEHMEQNSAALEVYLRVKKLVELFPDDDHFRTPTIWTEWGQLDELITKLQS